MSKTHWLNPGTCNYQEKAHRPPRGALVKSLVLFSLLSFLLLPPLWAQSPSNISNGGVQVTCTTTSGVLLAAQTSPANRVWALLMMESGVSGTRVCQAAVCTLTTGLPFSAGQTLYDAPATYGGAYSCITPSATALFSVGEGRRE